jgi:phosphoglycolate phosphatase
MLTAAGANIEIVRAFAPRPDISHVIFDFDGTLSWLRHGWPEIMYEVFRGHLPPRPGESEETVHALLMNDILSLNGKPSMYQMLKLADRVLERGGVPPPSEKLLGEYQHRLDVAIEERSARITGGDAAPDEFVVFGARALLDRLRQHGTTAIILSGTIEHRVKAEAGLLGLSDYFAHHVYGGHIDHRQFSKRAVMERLLQEEKIEGRHLLSFGDGPVEIQNTKELGGLAIGVASDEHHNGSGVCDPFKRTQLIQAGADAIIADYRDASALMTMIFGN